MKKIYWGIGLLSLAVAWAGSGVYMGIKAEQRIQDLVNQPATRITRDMQAVVRNAQHQRGLWTSTGAFDVLLEYTKPRATEKDAPPELTVPLKAQLRYTMDHFPLPSAAARFQWELDIVADAENQEILNRMMGSPSGPLKIKGDGDMNLGGGWSNVTQIPQLVWGDAQAWRMVVEPSRMFNTSYGKRRTSRWKAERINFTVDESKHTASIQEVEFASARDADPQAVVVAESSFKIGRIVNPFVTLEKLRSGIQVTQTENTFNIEGNLKADSLAFMNYGVSRFEIQEKYSGFDKKSLMDLYALATSQDIDLKNLSLQHRKDIVSMVDTIMLKGIKFEIPKFNGLVIGAQEGASVDASMMIELKPSQASVPSLLDQFQFKWQTQLKGRVFPNFIKQSLLKSGIFVEQGNALVASYEGSKDHFEEHGQPGDATYLNQEIMKLETAFLRWRENFTSETPPDEEPDALHHHHHGDTEDDDS